MNQDFNEAHRWLVSEGMIEVTQPSRTYGRNIEYSYPPFLMPFLYAEDRGHKYMSLVTLCQEEVFVHEGSIDHLLNLFWRFWDPSASRGDHEPLQFHDIGL